MQEQTAFVRVDAYFFNATTSPVAIVVITGHLDEVDSTSRICLQVT